MKLMMDFLIKNKVLMLPVLMMYSQRYQHRKVLIRMQNLRERQQARKRETALEQKNQK